MFTGVESPSLGMLMGVCFLILGFNSKLYVPQSMLIGVNFLLQGFNRKIYVCFVDTLNTACKKALPVKRHCHQLLVFLTQQHWHLLDVNKHEEVDCVNL